VPLWLPLLLHAYEEGGPARPGQPAAAPGRAWATVGPSGPAATHGIGPSATCWGAGGGGGHASRSRVEFRSPRRDSQGPWGSRGMVKETGKTCVGVFPTGVTPTSEFVCVLPFPRW